MTRLLSNGWTDFHQVLPTDVFAMLFVNGGTYSTLMVVPTLAYLLAYLLVLPGSRARIVRCGGRYDPQLVKRSSE